MTLLKYLSKLLNKSEESKTSQSIVPKFRKSTRTTGTSNLIATTTIKKISYKTKLVPLAESSALTTTTTTVDTKSLCNTCTRKYQRPKKYCKCCGQEVVRRVNFEEKKNVS